MKKIVKEYEVYKFNELSEDSKQRAIEKLSDINTGYDWYECIYDDAKSIDIEIQEFDIYHNDIEIKSLNDTTVIANKILALHGQSCDTYKLAYEFLKTIRKILESDSQYDDTCSFFIHELGQCFLQMLKEQYEYLTSEQGIIDTIEAHDYDFTSDGKLF